MEIMLEMLESETVFQRVLCSRTDVRDDVLVLMILGVGWGKVLLKFNLQIKYKRRKNY